MSRQSYFLSIIDSAFTTVLCNVFAKKRVRYSLRMRIGKSVLMTEPTVQQKVDSTGVLLNLTDRERVHILHVDDDSCCLKVAKECLEMQGKLQVDTALSAEAAVEKMKNKKYDVVICDYAMPTKDGLEFLKDLQDGGNDIPFIIFTGEGREEVAIKALNLGADRYFNKVGDPETVYGELAHSVFQVVQGRKREEALGASEDYLKAILSSISAGVLVIDAETHEIMDVNSNALEAIGASREHVIGRVCHNFICPAEKGKCPITDLGQAVDKSERVLLRADGGKIPILKTVVTMTWKGHKYMVESFVDITERKKVERALLENQEKFKQLFMDSPEAAVYTDQNSLILDINPRFTELFGYSLDEVKGKDVNDVVVQNDKIEEAEMLDKASLEGCLYHETVRKRKDGSLVPVSISVAPITFEGKTIGSVGLYRDITERKRYERSLSALNNYGQSLNMANSVQEICELALDAAQKTLGFKFADFLLIEGKNLHLVENRGRSKDFTVTLPMDGDRGVTVKVAKAGETILLRDTSEEAAYVKFGENIHSELAVPIKVGNEVLGVLNVESNELNAFNEKDQELLEILASHAGTAMIKLEYSKNLEAYAQEIQESQQKFEKLFMANPEAMVYMDSSFHILEINPRFTKLFGYSPAEVIGKHINDIIVPMDRMEQARMFDERASKGETYHEDTVRKRKDGTLIPVAFSTAPIVVGGQVISHTAVYKDISQLKKAEEGLREALKRLEAMNEKLRVVGRLSRHDVRNKLSAVVGNAYLTKKKLPANSEALNYVAEIEKAVQQAVRIFDFARAYEMLGAEELVYVGAEKTINEAVSLFSDMYSAKVTNECYGLQLLADSLLRELFYNLIDNSLKYGKKITQIRIFYEKSEDQLRLVYEDDGVGITPGEKLNLFKEGIGKGTGYGLYLIKKMMEVYGWTIQDTGQPGQGARFLITIPAINEKGKANYKLD
ncbi:MAG: PAS domain S-box protein [Candidatus Bathyarchaeia archaeon]